MKKCHYSLFSIVILISLLFFNFGCSKKIEIPRITILIPYKFRGEARIEHKGINYGGVNNRKTYRIQLDSTGSAYFKGLFPEYYKCSFIFIKENGEEVNANFVDDIKVHSSKLEEEGEKKYYVFYVE